MKQRLATVVMIIVFIAHGFASADSIKKEDVQPAKPSFVSTESVNDSYKLSLEELLKPGGDIVRLMSVAKGDDAPRAQTVAYKALVAKNAGKQYLEDIATIELLNMLREKYPVNATQNSESETKSKRTIIRRTRTIRPAVRGFAALGLHGGHAKNTEQGSQKPQENETPAVHGKTYKVSDISDIASIRMQIANDYSEKVTETMLSASAYKSGIEHLIKVGQPTIALQGDRIIGGYLTFIVFGDEVYFRISALPKGMYDVSNLNRIDIIQARIAEDFGKDIAETMPSVSAYKAGIKDAVRERGITVTLQGTEIIGGYIRFVIVEEKVQYGIVQHDK